jgi:hypothetical protein
MFYSGVIERLNMGSGYSNGQRRISDPKKSINRYMNACVTERPTVKVFVDPPSTETVV